MQTRSSSADGKPQKKYYSVRKKYCAFCKDKNHPGRLQELQKPGKLYFRNRAACCRPASAAPARTTRSSLRKAIKRARHMALMKFIEEKRGY